MKSKEIDIEFDVLYQSIDYDKNTGKFTWKRTLNGNSLKGSNAGCITKAGYITIRFQKKEYKAHRLAWFYTYKKSPSVIDHINGDKLDNRIENLRDVSFSENRQNLKKPTLKNKSGYLGVIKVSDLFLSKLVVNRKVVHLKYFKTKEDAYDSYINAKRFFHSANTI